MSDIGQESSASVPTTRRTKPPRNKASERMLSGNMTAVDAASAPQQEDEQHVQMRALLQLAEDRGFLTYAEINDRLPDSLVQTAAVDSIACMFNDMGIAVRENAPDTETLLFNNAASHSLLDGGDASEAALSMTDSQYGRANDPVSIYFREMSATALLTRSGEIALAKRIEDGRSEVVMAIVERPATVATILDSASRVVAGDLPVNEMVEGLNHRSERDEPPPADSGVPVDIDSESVVANLDAGRNGTPGEMATEAQLRQLTTDSLVIFYRVGDLFGKLCVAHAWRNIPSAEETHLRKEMLCELGRVRFTAPAIERLCADVRRQADEVRTIVRVIMRIAVDQSAMPRALFVEAFPGHETDLDWSGRMSGTSPTFGATLARLAPSIQAEQQKLIGIEERETLRLAQLMEIDRKMTSAESKVRRAKHEMTEANLRLVISIARRYMNRGMDLLDLAQEGNIGLMKAVDKFEYRRGWKFSTYATWWIRQAMTRALADQGLTIRLPVHLHDTAKRLNRISHEMWQQTGKRPEPAALAARLRIPEAKVRGILTSAKQPVSLDTPFGENGGPTLGDMVSGSFSASPVEATLYSDMRASIDEALSSLTPREAKVLRLRFGIGTVSGHTFDALAAMFGVTRERVRQIEGNALTKIRDSNVAEQLRSILKD